MSTKLHRKTLEVIKEGIYVNIYQKYVSVIDVDMNKACSQMINFYDFIPQLEGINVAFPNLICTTYNIDLVKPGNTSPNLGQKYGHKHWGISNEEDYYKGIITLSELIEQVKFTKREICKSNYDEALFYNVMSCNILCIDSKSNHKQNRRSKITKSIRHEVFKKDNYRCVECGASNKETTLHIDHIIPIALGGTDKTSNLQVLCIECNEAKATSTWKGGVVDYPTKVKLKELGLQDGVEAK